MYHVHYINYGNKRGQSLLEVVIALGIIVVVLVGLVRVTTQSVRNTSSSQNETLTARYGTEVEEWLKSNKDALGWVQFVSSLAASPSRLGTVTSDATWCLQGPLLINPVNPGTSLRNSFTAPPPDPGCIPMSGTTLTRTVGIGTTQAISSRDQLIQFTINISWVEGSITRTAQYITKVSSVENP